MGVGERAALWGVHSGAVTANALTLTRIIVADTSITHGCAKKTKNAAMANAATPLTARIATARPIFVRTNASRNFAKNATARAWGYVYYPVTGWNTRTAVTAPVMMKGRMVAVADWFMTKRRNAV